MPYTVQANEYVVVEADSKNLTHVLQVKSADLEFLNLEIVHSDGVNEAGESVQKYKLLFKVPVFIEQPD